MSDTTIQAPWLCHGRGKKAQSWLDREQAVFECSCAVKGVISGDDLRTMPRGEQLRNAKAAAAASSTTSADNEMPS